MKDIYKLHNKGKVIGQVSAYILNIKKLMVMAGLGFSLLTAVGCGREEITDEMAIEEANESYDSYEENEPRYNVLYTVKFGDTLTDLVYSYEGDTNKVYGYLDDIVYKNDLRSASSISAGMELTLVGVPESKLAQFGYSSDYSLFNPEYELNDRIAYINEHLSAIYETEDNKVDVALFKAKLGELEEMLKDYYSEANADTKEYIIDYLVTEYRDLSDELKSLTGYDFESHHPAYPLSEAINEVNKNTLG